MQTDQKIRKIITKHGLSPSGEAVLLGLELSNGRIAWGCCPNLLEQQTPVQTIEQRIRPILQDQSLDSFQTLITQIDNLKNSVTITRLIQPVSQKAAGGTTLSRRRLISGLLVEDEPQTEAVVEERPLPPAICFGISQALFKAVALSQNKSLLTVMTETYDLPESPTAVPFMLNAAEPAINQIIPAVGIHFSSLTYNTSSVNPKQTLGANAEKLQQHVRQVKDWLTAVAPDMMPDIHLNLQGGFTDLYENNEGKILGAIHGLEQAASPYPLTVQNVMKGEGTAVIQALKKLQSYMRTRKMKTKLAIGFDLFPADVLRLVVEDEAVGQIHLDPIRFGSIQQTIQFILLCKKRSIDVILQGEGETVETAVALGLAAQVHALSGPPDLLYNEMVRVIG